MARYGYSRYIHRKPKYYVETRNGCDNWYDSFRLYLLICLIEPGLYIPDHPSYPSEYRGIAIRIEDDIAIGGPKSGGEPIILSAEAPKEIDDIEAVMAGIVPVQS